MQYNSNLHNMLRFHGCMFLERGNRKFS